MKKRIVILILFVVFFLLLGVVLTRFIIPRVSENTDNNRNEIVNNIVENNIDESKEDKNIDEWRGSYKRILNEYKEKGNVVYTIYDMEKDNIPELIIRTGNSEAEYKYYFYRYMNEKAENIGEMGGGHTLLYGMNDGKYIMAVYAHMDYEIVYHIYIEDDKFLLEEKSQREIGVNQNYVEGDKYLELYDINDISLIDNYLD